MIIIISKILYSTWSLLVRGSTPLKSDQQKQEQHGVISEKFLELLENSVVAKAALYSREKKRVQTFDRWCICKQTIQYVATLSSGLTRPPTRSEA